MIHIKLQSNRKVCLTNVEIDFANPIFESLLSPSCCNSFQLILLFINRLQAGVQVFLNRNGELRPCAFSLF
jgi:hypothetical protein